MLSELQVQFSEMVIVPVTAATAKITLPQDATTIENGRIIAIEAYSVAQLGTTPDQRVTVNANAFNNAFLTLRNRETGHDDYHQVPLRDLLRDNNSGIMERIKSLKVDVSQSYIEVGNTSTLTLGECFLFRFVYEQEGVGCAKD